MKKIISFLGLVLIFSYFTTELYSKTTDGWELIAPSPQTNSLNDICLIPGTEKVITVGEGGIVMISSDYGESWEIMEDKDLKDKSNLALDFVDSHVGYILSKNNKLLKTEDQGVSWKNVEVFANEPIQAIDFFDEDNGILVGDKGLILKTENSGLSWDVIDSNTEEDLKSIYYLSSDTVFVVGGHGDWIGPYDQAEEVCDGIILKSVNKGNDWNIIETAKVDNYSCIGSNNNGTMFFGAGYIQDTPFDYLLEFGYIFKSSNSCESFDKIKFSSIPHKIKFLDKNIGFLLCHNIETYSSTIYRTLDGGNTWELLKRLPRSIKNIEIVNSQISVSVGNYGSIVRTEDNWQTEAQNYITIFYFKSIDILDDSTTFIMSRQKLYKSYGGFNDCNEIFSTDLEKNLGIYDLTITESINENIIFVNGLTGPGHIPTSRLIKTEDGGNTWNLIHGLGNDEIISEEMNNIIKLCFYDENNGFVIGTDLEEPYLEYGNLIFRTRDGGQNWEEVEFENEIADMFFENETVGYLCGKNGLLMKTTDGGDSWTGFGNIEQNDFSKIIFNSNHGVLTTQDKKCLYTSDGGQTWNLSFNAKPFTSLQILENKVCYATDEEGDIYLSTNGGEQWLWQNKGVNNRLTSISFLDSNIGYAVGSNGVILKTELGVTGYYQSLLDYYPLQIGNRWTYHSLDENRRSSYYTVEVVGDTLMENGKNYSILDKSGSLSCERVDTLTANIYRYDNNGGEFLIDSLKSLVNDQCSANRFGWDNAPENGSITKCESINKSVAVLGQLTVEKEFQRANIPYNGSRRYYKLSKGFGLTYHYNKGAIGGDMELPRIDSLVYCCIDGKEYGSLYADGTIAQNTVWSADTVKVVGDITVAGGVVLNINKGTVIQFQGDYKLNIKGSLNAVGSAGDRIVFNKREGGEDWRGITFVADPAKIDTSLLKFCVISDVDNPWNGGGIVVLEGNKVIISDCIIEECDSQGNGGGIYVSDADVSIINCLLNNNHATGNGGAIALENSDSYLLNTTISDNKSENNGGGLYIKDSKPQIYNSIIFYNEAEKIGNQVYVEGSEETPGFYFCDIEEGLAAFGLSDILDFTNYYLNNIDLDPQFNPDPVVDKSYKNYYTISKNSPCINKGSADTSGLNIPQNDLAGHNRIIQERIDIGSYECRNPNGIEDENIATDLTLYQNYPNPFNPTTTISYFVPENFSGVVNLKIYNCLGQLVNQLGKKIDKAGLVKMNFNASSLPSGLYYYGIKAGEKVLFKKMMLLK